MDPGAARPSRDVGSATLTLTGAAPIAAGRAIAALASA
jgi:hypothetical protein